MFAIKDDVLVVRTWKVLTQRDREVRQFYRSPLRVFKIDLGREFNPYIMGSHCGGYPLPSLPIGVPRCTSGPFETTPHCWRYFFLFWVGASNVLHLKRGGDKEEQMQLWPDPAVPRQANKWCSNIDPIIYKMICSWNWRSAVLENFLLPLEKNLKLAGNLSKPAQRCWYPLCMQRRV